MALDRVKQLSSDFWANMIHSVQGFSNIFYKSMDFSLKHSDFEYVYSAAPHFCETHRSAKWNCGALVREIQQEFQISHSHFLQVSQSISLFRGWILPPNGWHYIVDPSQLRVLQEWSSSKRSKKSLIPKQFRPKKIWILIPKAFSLKFKFQGNIWRWYKAPWGPCNRDRNIKPGASYFWGV